MGFCTEHQHSVDRYIQQNLFVYDSGTLDGTANSGVVSVNHDHNMQYLTPGAKQPRMQTTQML